MPIVYALVAQDDTILVEAANPALTGNFKDISREILKRRKAQQEKEKQRETEPHKDGKFSYALDGFTFNFRSYPSGLQFMVMASADYGRSLAFIFLNDVSATFFKQFDMDCGGVDVERDGTRYTSFVSILHAKIKKYCSEEDFTKLRQLRSNIEEVKDVMKTNIERVMRRGETIENLVDKSGSLHGSLGTFKRSSSRLASAMWWTHIKTKAASVACVALILYVFLGLFCGLDLSHC